MRRILFVLIAVFVLFYFASCGDNNSGSQDTGTGSATSTGTLTGSGTLTGTSSGTGTNTGSTVYPSISLTGLQSAAAYSESKGGAAVLCMQNGVVIFEDYHNGADENTATHVHSATKGFSASMLAAAIEDGLIDGMDENASDTITEWQSGLNHPLKSRITVGYLAALASGLSQDVDYIQGDDPLAPDIYAYVVENLSITTQPGTHFQYGPSHYYAFGVLLERKLHAAGRYINPLEYLEERILDVIGMEYESWIHDPAGNPHIPNGCHVKPREWVKFGRFILQKGEWEGGQVIDRSLMEDLFVPQGPNLGHGKFLWLNTQGGMGSRDFMVAPPGSDGGFIYHDGYTDIIGCLGAGKNRMYIVPSLNAVIIRQTVEDTSNFDDHDFLGLILP